MSISTDNMILALQELGIVRAMTAEEAASTKVDVVLGRSDTPLSEPADRAKYYDLLLHLWRTNLPTLKHPGISLCEPCEGITVAAMTSQDGYLHSQSYWHLAASAERCRMCSLIESSLRTRDSEDFDALMRIQNPRETSPIILGLGDWRPSRGSKETKEGDGEASSPDVSHELESRAAATACVSKIRVWVKETVVPPGQLHVFALPGTRAASLGIQTTLPAAEDTKINAIKEWLRGKIGSATAAHLVPALESPSHPIFPPDPLPVSPSPPTLPPPPPPGLHPASPPTRLLDVGESDISEEGNSTSKVHLIETCGLAGAGTESLAQHPIQYVALSYRWGKEGSHFTTTRSTIGAMKAGVYVKEIPKTLRDAIILTRKLGLRYLWVDAICIIQDDEEDWAHEAARMGDVYMGTYCTIAAHAAEHADAGFLARPFQRVTPLAVGGSHRGEPYDEEAAAYQAATSGAGYEPFRSQAFFVSSGPDPLNHLTNSQLSSRGWVLQERILSPRTIHCTGGGHIYLEDHEQIRHIDAGGGSKYRQFTSVRRGLELLQTNRSVQRTLPQELSESIRLGWYEIAGRYSSLSLTKPEDKLIAISGIARKMQQLTDDRYYSGLWAGNIHACLLWLRHTTALKSGPTRRAPTWSWAASDGEIQYPLWSYTGSDSKLRPEVKLGPVLTSPSSLADPPASIFAGPATLELHSAVIISTGLRFRDVRTGKPQWTWVVNVVGIRFPTRFWDVYADDGRLVGWASLDMMEADEIDGEELKISCIKIASFSDDRPDGGGLDRGYMVLFLMRRSGAWVRVGMGQITQRDLFRREGGTVYIL